MIAERSNGVRFLVHLCQSFLVTVAFWLWLSLCYNFRLEQGVISRYLIYNAYILLGILLRTWRIPVNVCFRPHGFKAVCRQSARLLGSALFFLLFYLAASHDAQISRLFFFGFIPLLYGVLLLSNYLLPAFLGRLIFREKWEQKVLLVGPARKAMHVKHWVDANKYLGLRIFGLLTEDKLETEDPSMVKLGQPTDLDHILTTPGIMMVILVEFPRSTGMIQHLTEICEGCGIRLLVVADIDRNFGHSVTAFEDQGILFIGLREEPLQDPVNRFLKRCLDIAISLPVVVFILPPLILMVGIIHLLRSPGVLLFRQPREGFQNQHFPILKFRTMHVGDPKNEKLPSSKNDPRLFQGGSLLRKTSLDEIPQFWNVLWGDMSVVGPRPHLPSYNQQYRTVFPRAYIRSYVKPGITGLAQARGFRGTASSENDIIRRIESDIEYLENWSFWLDCTIVLRTALQILVPPKTAV